MPQRLRKKLSRSAPAMVVVTSQSPKGSSSFKETASKDVLIPWHCLSAGLCFESNRYRNLPLAMCCTSGRTVPELLERLLVLELFRTEVSKPANLLTNHKTHKTTERPKRLSL